MLVNKKDFFVLLAEKLLDRGLDDEQILKQIRHFDKYLSKYDASELESEIEALGSCDELADAIVEHIRSKEAGTVSSASESESEADDPDSDMKIASPGSPDSIDDTATSLDNTVASIEASGSDDMLSEEDEASAKEAIDLAHTIALDIATEGTTTHTDDTSDDMLSDPAANESEPLASACNKTKIIDAVQLSELYTEATSSIVGDTPAEETDSPHREEAETLTDEIEKEYDRMYKLMEAHSEEEKTIVGRIIPDNRILGMSASTMFWVLLIVTLPISLTAAVLYFAFFALGYVVLAAALCALVILLAADIAGGTGLFLFGIIYGAGQMAASVPIGLYEIGFAVIIAGLAVLLGVLIYNASFVLMPFVIKRYSRWFADTTKHLCKLIARIKRECDQA